MAKNDRVYRVGISGSYGGLNLGDEAILQVILQQLRAELPVQITVFSRDPQDTCSGMGWSGRYRSGACPGKKYCLKSGALTCWSSVGKPGASSVSTNLPPRMC
jgi:polysaccharide pyruvyl transferase WcaK-like protein